MIDRNPFRHPFGFGAEAVYEPYEEDTEEVSDVEPEPIASAEFDFEDLPDTDDISDDTIYEEYLEIEEDDEEDYEQSDEEYYGTRFVTKDSGKRSVRPSGYQRDTQEGKPRFDLMLPLGVPYEEQFLTRLALLLSRGAEKYDERNWERADDQVDLDRFKSSAFRHLMQWMNGEIDEDHAAAVAYNLLAHETTKYKIESQ